MRRSVHALLGSIGVHKGKQAGLHAYVKADETSTKRQQQLYRHSKMHTCIQQGYLLLKCASCVIKISLLYGLLNRIAAYVIPTWLMREQRLAQVNINQSSVRLQVSIVNSTWTAGHIRQLWWTWKAPTVVFPPCNTLTLQQLPIDRKLKRLYLVSVAQFRPEKNHQLQLEAFARARQAALQDPDSAGWSHSQSCHDFQWASAKSATYSAV